MSKSRFTFLGLMAFPIGLTLVVVNAANRNREDVLGFLRERNASVASALLKMRVARIEVNREDGRCLSVALDTLVNSDTDTEDPVSAFSRLLAQVRTDRLSWAAYETKQKGPKFRQTAGYGKQTLVLNYDGNAYIYYQDNGNESIQADIFFANRHDRVMDTEELNITTRKLVTYPMLREQQKDGLVSQTFQIATDPQGLPGKTVTVEYDKRYALVRMRAEKAGELFANRWFFGYRMENGVPVPRGIAEVRPTKEACRVLLIALDTVQINPRIKDTEFKLAIPPYAVVVDHRTNPARVSRAMERPGLLVDQSSARTIEEIGSRAVPRGRSGVRSVPPYEDIQRRGPSPRRAASGGAQASDLRRRWVYAGMLFAGGVFLGLLWFLLRRSKSFG